MQSPPFPVTSSLLGPNILLNTMFSNTLSFLSTRNVNDQVSHPYKTGKIIVLYINIRINFLFDTMSLKIRMFGLWKYRLSWRDQRWRRFYSTQYIILFELQCFTLFYSVPPQTNALNWGHDTFFHRLSNLLHTIIRIFNATQSKRRMSLSKPQINCPMHNPSILSTQ